MPKRILWNLSCWENLPKIFNCGLLLLPGKIVGRNLEQIHVEGCQTSVCARLQLGVNFALTAKYYSPRDTSSASHIHRGCAALDFVLAKRFFDFRPAVNRQPMFPREMTRRADAACPPTDSHSEFSRLLQRTRSKNKRKHRFSVKIMIFGATMKTLILLGK